jgi:hypothetical protein
MHGFGQGRLTKGRRVSNGLIGQEDDLSCKLLASLPRVAIFRRAQMPRWTDATHDPS